MQIGIKQSSQRLRSEKQNFVGQDISDFFVKVEYQSI
jgi:hypothetical protein